MAVALLDTNAISDLMRDHPQIKARIATHADPIVSSVVAVGEIYYGLERLPAGKKRSDLEARAHVILAALRIELISEPIAKAYGQLKASLEAKGLVLGDNDLWIAATAINFGHTLVTRSILFEHPKPYR
jgi:predicted nucleic acid-binding protein